MNWDYTHQDITSISCINGTRLYSHTDAYSSIYSVDFGHLKLSLTPYNITNNITNPGNKCMAGNDSRFQGAVAGW